MLKSHGIVLVFSVSFDLILHMQGLNSLCRLVIVGQLCFDPWQGQKYSQIQIFCNVTLCCPTYSSSLGSSIPTVWSWRWRNYDPTACWEPLVPGHNMAYQKTWSFSSSAVWTKTPAGIFSLLLQWNQPFNSPIHLPVFTGWCNSEG